MAIRVLRVMPKSGTNANPEDWKATPKCESRVQIIGDHSKGWRQKRYGEDWDKCSRPSTVELDGAKLCRRHAGERVLEDLIAGKYVRVEE